MRARKRIWRSGACGRAVPSLAIPRRMSASRGCGGKTHLRKARQCDTSAGQCVLTASAAAASFQGVMGLARFKELGSGNRRFPFRCVCVCARAGASAQATDMASSGKRAIARKPLQGTRDPLSFANFVASIKQAKRRPMPHMRRPTVPHAVPRCASYPPTHPHPYPLPCFAQASTRLDTGL